MRKLIENWKQRRAERKRIQLDGYLERLNNSSHGLCGTRHSGDGPFLTIDEVRALIWQELERTATPSEKQL